MNNIAMNLTMIRIGLIPIFVVVFYLPFGWVNWAVALIFGVAAVTDWLDGYLARKLDQTSALGAFLDPVADKLMVCVALVLLVQENPSPWMALPTAVIIGREVAVSALREWMAEVGHRSSVAVNSLGKLKTTAQMLSILLLLYRDTIYGVSVLEIGYVLLYLAAGLTFWSMAIYLKAAWPTLFGQSD